jgi:hypothetical protein
VENFGEMRARTADMVTGFSATTQNLTTGFTRRRAGRDHFFRMSVEQAPE